MGAKGAYRKPVLTKFELNLKEITVAQQCSIGFIDTHSHQIGNGHGNGNGYGHCK